MLYYVCRMDCEGNWQGLRSTSEEDYAERLCEFYAEQYPNAYVDVLTYDEFHAIK